MKKNTYGRKITPMSLLPTKICHPCALKDSPQNSSYLNFTLVSYRQSPDRFSNIEFLQSLKTTLKEEQDRFPTLKNIPINIEFTAKNPLVTTLLYNQVQQQEACIFINPQLYFALEKAFTDTQGKHDILSLLISIELEQISIKFTQPYHQDSPIQMTLPSSIELTAWNNLKQSTRFHNVLETSFLHFLDILIKHNPQNKLFHKLSLSLILIPKYSYHIN